MDEEAPPDWVRILRHPAASMGLGLLCFPLAKLLWIPNYVFNFLTTLVHECGHAACAWLQGRFSIPSVGIGGGGVTVWGERHPSLCALLLIALVALAIRERRRPAIAVPLGIAAFLYIGVAFLDTEGLFVAAGGVLFELGGAAACFYAVFGLDLERPFERPLYALWGWWMLLNRMSEIVLMLKSPEYWEAQRVYESGLAAGLTNDLHLLVDFTGWSHKAVLGLLFVFGILAPLAGIGLAFLRRALAAARD